MSRRLVLLLLLLAAGGAAAQPLPTDPSAPDPLAGSRPDPLAPTVIVSPAGAQVVFGEPLTVAVTIIHTPDQTIELPVELGLPDSWLEVGARKSSRRVLDDGMVRDEIALSVAPLEVGTLTFPPLPVGYAAGGEHRQVASESFTVDVESAIGEGEAELRGVAGPITVLERDWTAAWAAGGAFAALGLAFLVWRLWPRRRVAAGASLEAVAKVPAPARLRALLSSPLLEQSDAARRQIFFAASEIVRGHVGDVLGFEALELTTAELLAEAGRKQLGAPAAAALASWCGECDLVKYAGVEVGRDQTVVAIEAALALVERLAPAPVAAPAEAA